MMDDFETNLATALRSVVSAPPTEIDPADIIRATRPRRTRTLVAPLAAALVVAIIAVGILTLANSEERRPRQAGSPPAIATNSPVAPLVSRQPSDLLGPWNLIELRGLDGGAHTAPDATLTFKFDPNGLITQGCSAARATVGVGTLRFVQDFVTATPTNCPHLGVQQSQFLFGQVLTGTARWEIRNGELTIQRNGAAAVFQHVDRA